MFINKLNNNHFSPNAISHKDLKTLLNKAKKELTSINSSKNLEVNGNHEFNDLIKDWTVTSKKILVLINENDQELTKNKNPQSLMALGAMAAHINMALQALKATGSNQ